jgi:hypothetical protein
MKNLTKMGVAFGLLLAAAAGALAQQTISPRSLTGTETVEGSSGPGGQSFYIAVPVLRNAQGVALTALTTGTLSTLDTKTATLISTAASVSLTVNLPAIPSDGQIFEWANGSGGAFTQGTIAQTDGSTLVGTVTTGALAAGSAVEWRYVQSTNTWYRIR